MCGPGDGLVEGRIFSAGSRLSSSVRMLFGFVHARITKAEDNEHVCVLHASLGGKPITLVAPDTRYRGIQPLTLDLGLCPFT